MKNQVSLCCFDLGINLGWSRILCTIRPELQINVIDHGTINLDLLTEERLRKEYNNVYSRNRFKMIVFEEQIIKLINQVKYDCFVSEDVFCNPKRVNAFRSLAIYFEALERIINVEKQKRLYTVTPTLIKKHIAEHGHSDKILVQQSVLNNKLITMKKPETATEHEFDSIGCGYAYIMEYLMLPI